MKDDGIVDTCVISFGNMSVLKHAVVDKKSFTLDYVVRSVAYTEGSGAFFDEDVFKLIMPMPADMRVIILIKRYLVNPDRILDVTVA